MILFLCIVFGNLVGRSQLHRSALNELFTFTAGSSRVPSLLAHAATHNTIPRLELKRILATELTAHVAVTTFLLRQLRRLHDLAAKDHIIIIVS